MPGLWTTRHIHCYFITELQLLHERIQSSSGFEFGRIPDLDSDEFRIWIRSSSGFEFSRIPDLDSVEFGFGFSSSSGFEARGLGRVKIAMTNIPRNTV